MNFRLPAAARATAGFLAAFRAIVRGVGRRVAFAPFLAFADFLIAFFFAFRAMMTSLLCEQSCATNPTWQVQLSGNGASALR
jgi:hypothetical protein